MKKTFSVSMRDDGITARDDVIYQLRDNERLTVKSIRLFVMDVQESSNVEIWVGARYEGCQSLLAVHGLNVMAPSDVVLTPNAVFEANEKLVVTVALGDAGAVSQYSICYEVETIDDTWPAMEAAQIQPCNLIARLTGRC